MKKVAVLTVIFIVINFICCNFVFADEMDLMSSNLSEGDYKSISEKGLTDIDGTQVNVDTTESTVGSATGMSSSIAGGTFFHGAKWMANLAINGGLYRTDSDYSTYKTGIFTICSLVFGEYLLFDGKIFQTTASLNPEITPTSVIKIMDDIKENCSSWSKVISNVAISASIVIFIYSLIRMALSNTGEDLAVWKKVMVRWLTSLILMFMIYLILIAMHKINDVIMDALWTVRTDLEASGYSSFEVELFKASKDNIQNSAGNVSLAYTLEFVAMTIFQIMFFVKYVFRAFGMILLFFAAPIFIILHTIRSLNGRDDNTLKDFFKNYAILLFVQPMHAFLYLLFMFSLSEIALKAPLLGIIFLYALYRGEKVIKAMLNLNGGLSLKGLLGKK